MAGLLEPGRTYQFNALFLDPTCGSFRWAASGWCRRPCQSGVMIDGVVIAPASQTFDEAVELIDELGAIGITQPGAIRLVIRIATAVPTAGDEGGVPAGTIPGGISTTRCRLPTGAPRANIRCVGGGIGHPEKRAVKYGPGVGRRLTVSHIDADRRQSWSAPRRWWPTRNPPRRHRSSGVTDTQGTDQISAGAKAAWPPAASQLGADIHEIGNSASPGAGGYWTSGPAGSAVAECSSLRSSRRWPRPPSPTATSPT